MTLMSDVIFQIIYFRGIQLIKNQLFATPANLSFIARRQSMSIILVLKQLELDAENTK